MQKNHFELDIPYIEKIKSSNRVKIKWSFLLILILFCCGLSSNDKQISKIDVIIKSVVSGTEEGFVLTDKGYFQLPSPGDEVEMEYKTVNVLIENLERAIDHKSILFLYDNTIVGILSESQDINFKPDFTKRQKKIYTSPPITITTTMKRWDIDTYRLSIKTIDGTFCISNAFEVKDYYDKVYQKLKEHYKMGEDLNEIITLKYHKIEDSYECQGDIEDIVVK